MTDFKDKVVFVTGGASGIGSSIVKAFRASGAIVCFCDVVSCNDENSYQLDVKDAAALETAFNNVVSRYGDVDIVINNVGVSQFSPLTDISVEEFDDVIATNLRPAFITARLFARLRNSEFGKSKFGSIVNIASTRYLQSEQGSEAYAASKGGIVSLTHALAISFSEYNVTVNSISPGWIDNGKFGELSLVDHKQHPSGRVGNVEDIARMVLFITNPNNNFINGENIVIDGGMTKKMIYEE